MLLVGLPPAAFVQISRDISGGCTARGQALLGRKILEQSVFVFARVAAYSFFLLHVSLQQPCLMLSYFGERLNSLFCHHSFTAPPLPSPKKFPSLGGKERRRHPLHQTNLRRCTGPGTSRHRLLVAFCWSKKGNDEQRVGQPPSPPFVSRLVE